MSRAKISSALKVIGLVLFLWPFVLVLIAYTLSFIFWCDIQMAGVVESVDCAINLTVIESIIAFFINAHWFALLTTLPSLLILGVGLIATPKKSEIITNEQTTDSTQTSRFQIRVSKLAKWILIIFGGLFLFNLLVGLGLSLV